MRINKKKWPYRYTYLIVFTILIYLLIFRNTDGFWGFKENVILCFIASICFLWMSLSYKGNPVQREKISIYNWLPIIIFGFLVNLYSLKKIIAPFPMDKTNSDVIPQIQTLVQRFLNGDIAYKPIVFDGYELFPTYLPLQWMPYIISEFLRIDYRLFALLSIFIVFFFFIISIKNPKWFSVISVLPFIVINLSFWKDEASYYNCVENMMACYYMAFALCLVNEKRSSIWLQSILLGCCLLSRYSIILWSPLYFLFIYIRFDKKAMFKSIAIVFLMFFLSYLIPFFLDDPAIFIKGYKYHSIAALAEWTPSTWNANHYPYHLTNGLGFAIFFYDLVHGDISFRLLILQKTHILLSIISIVVVILIAWYRWRNKQLKPDGHFMLWSLALYLTFFYQFIQIPYVYLFVVPIYVYVVLFKSTIEKEAPIT